MSSDGKSEDRRYTAAKLQELLGPLPVPSTESPEQFMKVLDELLKCLQPRDMMEAMLIWDYAVPAWEINRYARLRAHFFEHRFRENRDLQIQRKKSEHARREELSKKLAQHLSQKPADISRAAYRERTINGLPEEIDEILKRTPTEIDHSEALEKHIIAHTEAESLIASLTRRRNEAFKMLDFYRAGLGSHVDGEMNGILEGEYKVVDEQIPSVVSPPVVPTSSTMSDRTTGNSTKEAVVSGASKK